MVVKGGEFGLKDHIVLGTMSINKIMFELSKMERIVEMIGVEYFATVPKKRLSRLSISQGILCL